MTSNLCTFHIKILFEHWESDFKIFGDSRVRTGFFSDNSAMTLTLDLEPWFKVTAHPKALWKWSMSQMGPRGEKLCRGQMISVRQTDKPITIEPMQSGVIVICKIHVILIENILPVFLLPVFFQWSPPPVYHRLWKHFWSTGSFLQMSY